MVLIAEYFRVCMEQAVGKENNNCKMLYPNAKLPVSDAKCVAKPQVGPGCLPELQLFSSLQRSCPPRKWLLWRVGSMVVHPAELLMLPETHLPQAPLPKSLGVSKPRAGNPTSPPLPAARGTDPNSTGHAIALFGGRTGGGLLCSFCLPSLVLFYMWVVGVNIGGCGFIGMHWKML